MKKKILLLVSILSLSIIFVGCSAKSDSGSSSSKKKASKTVEEKTIASSEPSSTSDGVDIDLTRLSATIVYTKVYNMMIAPEDYVGKKIKISGSFAYAKDEKTNKEYFAIINKDALACCAQGIEFEPKDMEEYRKNPPKENDHIVVVGTFDTYKEGELDYSVLREAKLER